MKMTHRERLLRTLRFESVDRGVDYEFGAWEQTITRWHKEGLPEKFTGFWGKENAINQYFKTDDIEYGPGPEVNVGLLPGFEFKVIEEKGDHLIARDGNGAIVEMLRPELGASIPRTLRNAIENRKDWEKIRDERLDPASPGRIPDNLDELCRKSLDADYPIIIGGVSLYGVLRNWIGLENISVTLYENETWIEEMMEHLAHLALTVFKNLAGKCKIDVYEWWEDMCYNKGPLISPAHFKKLMVPRYKRITDFLRHECGCEFNKLDSDGNIHELMPLWLEGGINVMVPLEVAATDAYKISSQFGKKVALCGYFNKFALIKGKETIDKEFKRLEPLFKWGGFIPHPDHCVPPDVSWENYCYYRKRKCEFIGKDTTL